MQYHEMFLTLDGYIIKINFLQMHVKKKWVVGRYLGFIFKNLLIVTLDLAKNLGIGVKGDNEILST